MRITFATKFEIAIIFVSLLIYSLPATASGLDDASLLTYEVGQNKLRYLDTGEGQPIIFIHGWSSHLGYWNKQIEEFRKTNRVIAYEWRGMGGSIGGEEPYEFAELVEDLKLFIESLNLKQKPIIVGHSLGALQAMHLASTYPNIPAAIVSVDAPGRKGLVTGRIMYWLMLTTFRLTGFLSEPNAIAIQTPINRFYFYSPDFIDKNKEKIGAWKAQFKSNSVEALINSFRAMTYRERIDQTVTRIPSLFVLGSKDRFISKEETEEYMSFFSGSSLELIQGAGHMSSEEQPKVFNQLLKNFLLSKPVKSSFSSDSM